MEEKKKAASGFVLASCLTAIDGGNSSVLEQMCDKYPDLAEEIRLTHRALVGLRNAHAETHGALSESPLERIGRFEIQRELGRGGVGIVYLARDTRLERFVALKVLASPLAAGPRQLERFRREATAISRVQHPNIVPLYEAGEDRGMAFIAMEYVRGIPLDTLLSSLISEGAHPTWPAMRILIDEWLRLEAANSDLDNVELPDAPGAPRSYLEAVVRIATQVAAALHHAHERGVIHRDIKPSNILITADCNAKLVDFGLAHEDAAFTVTRTGEFLGTPFYCSPEQVAARRMKIDRRTDVYSLGATLYELITHERSVRGYTTQEIFHQILTKIPRRPRIVDPNLPRDLETICLKALEKDPDDRYATAGDLADDLQAFSEIRPISARPAGMATRCRKAIARNRGASGVALGAIVLLAALLVWWYQKKGLVEIDMIAGVAVFVDGEHVGTTPVDSPFKFELAAGRHRLRFESDGFEPDLVAINVARIGTNGFKRSLVSSFGLLRIDSQPPEAAVSITASDGEVTKAVTPGLVRLRAGRYEIAADNPEYEASGREIVVPVGGDQVDWSARRPTGQLTITNNIGRAGARVFDAVSGELVAERNLPLLENLLLSPGDYTVAVNARNFVTRRFPVTIGVNKAILLNAYLPPILSAWDHNHDSAIAYVVAFGDPWEEASRVVTLSTDGEVAFLDPAGELVSTTSWPSGSGRISKLIARSAIGDLDGDGTNELAVARTIQFWNEENKTRASRSMIRVFHRDGSELWSSTQVDGELTWHAIWVTRSSKNFEVRLFAIREREGHTEVVAYSADGSERTLWRGAGSPTRIEDVTSGDALTMGVGESIVEVARDGTVRPEFKTGALVEDVLNIRSISLGRIDEIVGFENDATRTSNESSIVAFGAGRSVLWSLDLRSSVTSIWPLPGTIVEKPAIVVETVDNEWTVIGLDGEVRSKITVPGDDRAVLSEFDLDDDGVNEIIRTSSEDSEIGWVHCFSSAGELLWNTALAAPVNATSSVDFDGDGRNELAIATGSVVILINADGREVARYDANASVNSLTSIAHAVDARRQLVLGLQTGKVQALRTDPGLAWVGDLHGRATDLVAADFDADGETELVVATSTGWLNVFQSDGALRYRWKAEGRVKRLYASASGRLIIPMAGGRLQAHRLGKREHAIVWERRAANSFGGDILLVGADGHDERFIIAEDHSLVALDGNGQELWKTELGARAADIVLTRTTDGDAAYVMLVGFESAPSPDESTPTYRTDVLSVGYGGAILWHKQVTTDTNFSDLPDKRWQNLTVANVAPDPGAEILLSRVSTSEIVVLSSRGDVIKSGHPTGDLVLHMRSLDLDGDGNDEVLVGGNSTLVLMRGDEVEELGGCSGRSHLFDVDSNGLTEFITATYEGVIQVVETSGRRLWTNSGIVEGPKRGDDFIVADLDSDGLAELIACDQTVVVRRIRLPEQRADSRRLFLQGVRSAEQGDEGAADAAFESAGLRWVDFDTFEIEDIVARLMAVESGSARVWGERLMNAHGALDDDKLFHSLLVHEAFDEVRRRFPDVEVNGDLQGPIIISGAEAMLADPNLSDEQLAYGLHLIQTLADDWAGEDEPVVFELLGRLSTRSGLHDDAVTALEKAVMLLDVSYRLPLSVETEVEAADLIRLMIEVFGTSEGMFTPAKLLRVISELPADKRAEMQTISDEWAPRLQKGLERARAARESSRSDRSTTSTGN